MPDLDYQSLMEEPPGGFNHGRMASADPEEEGRWVPLDVESHQAAEFMRSGGFSVVDTSYGSGSGAAYGSRDAGMTSSRSSANIKPHVDKEQLQALVEEKLGFTLAQIAEAYATGRPSEERLDLRSQIDARLLDLSDKGGNMTALARIFGWRVRQDDGVCRTMAAALKRARAEA